MVPRRFAIVLILLSIRMENRVNVSSQRSRNTYDVIRLLIVVFFPAYDTFLMYSGITHIDSVHITDSEDMNPPYEIISSKTNMLNTIGLAYDYAHSLLFYSDIQRSTINSVYFNGSTHRIIVDRRFSMEE